MDYDFIDKLDDEERLSVASGLIKLLKFSEEFQEFQTKNKALEKEGTSILDFVSHLLTEENDEDRYKKIKSLQRIYYASARPNETPISKKLFNTILNIKLIPELLEKYANEIDLGSGEVGQALLEHYDKFFIKRDIKASVIDKKDEIISKIKKELAEFDKKNGHWNYQAGLYLLLSDYIIDKVISHEATPALVSKLYLLDKVLLDNFVLFDKLLLDNFDYLQTCLDTFEDGESKINKLRAIDNFDLWDDINLLIDKKSQERLAQIAKQHSPKNEHHTN